jgi:hypothetical protein
MKKGFPEIFQSVCERRSKLQADSLQAAPLCEYSV